MRLIPFTMILSAVLATATCGTPRPTDRPDARGPADAPAPVDAMVDALAIDAPLLMDAALDALPPVDAEVDALPPVDAELDALPPVDAEVDAPPSVDAAVDVPPPVDAAVDAAPLVDAPVDAAVDAPVPDAAVPSFDGEWSGTTSQQNRALSFTVLNNGITRIAVSFAVPGCGVSGMVTTTLGSPILIDATGTFTSSVAGVPLRYTITGTLTGSNSGSGTITFTWSQPFPPVCTASATATWSAVRQPPLP